ncbi:hypothetical protein RvY_07776 [Ramazzottius varieornatus]|uniref:Uncharacterized protein n=1 Tax=Ramazzottius varieornatus TaxID=947166 RepID=A0A1D1V3F0_RAMVA|nr:hypothetical protein RvY_07776 [Ramazzottius varieornatus]
MSYVTYPFASPSNAWYYPGASIFKKEPTAIDLGSDASSNAIITDGAIYNSNSAITTVGKDGETSNTEAQSLTQTQGLLGGLTSAAMARANRK